MSVFNRYIRYTEALGIGNTILYDFTDKNRACNDALSYMLNRTIHMFVYNNLPDTIPAYMLELMLQTNGFVGIAKHEGELYAYIGGLGGEPDVYYRPTILTVANPAQKLTAQWKIGEETALIYNDPLLTGLLPLYRKYATLEVENNISFRMGLINARIQKALVAGDTTAYESMKRYIDRLIAGELSVISDNPLINEARSLDNPDQVRYLVEARDTMQFLRASWYNEVGLDSNWNTKQSQIYADEAQMNRGGIMSLVDTMLAERESGLDRVNTLFGTDISVTLSDLWLHNHKLGTGTPQPTPEDPLPINEPVADTPMQATGDEGESPLPNPLDSPSPTGAEPVEHREAVLEPLPEPLVDVTVNIDMGGDTDVNQ